MYKQKSKITHTQVKYNKTKRKMNRNISSLEEISIIPFSKLQKDHLMVSKLTQKDSARTVVNENKATQTFQHERNHDSQRKTDEYIKCTTYFCFRNYKKEDNLNLAKQIHGNTYYSFF